MAKPIKETPVLTGKDAKHFSEKIANIKPESKEEKEAAKKPSGRPNIFGHHPIKNRLSPHPCT